MTLPTPVPPDPLPPDPRPPDPLPPDPMAPVPPSPLPPTDPDPVGRRCSRVLGPACPAPHRARRVPASCGRDRPAAWGGRG